MIFVNFLILIAGFAALVKGADIFVSGSSSLARNFHVPSLIIGLTIVALGTSAPELAVSTSAAFQGSNEIALSNVIGSNIFNLLCVLGICAIISPLAVDKGVLIRDFPLCLVTTALLPLLACGPVLFGGNLMSYGVAQEAGTITRPIGLIFILIFVLYIGVLIYITKKQNSAPEEDEGEKVPVWKCALFIIVGLALIIAGGEAVVYSAKEIARAAGMTETLIGLTIVAVGTSLPELVTSIVAARKGETGLAIGNAIGSNLFNLLLILGVSALVHPISVNIASVYDMLILLGISTVAFIFSLSGKRIARLEGILMVALYVGDVCFAIFR